MPTLEISIKFHDMEKLLKIGILGAIISICACSTSQQDTKSAGSVDAVAKETIAKCTSSTDTEACAKSNEDIAGSKIAGQAKEETSLVSYCCNKRNRTICRLPIKAYAGVGCECEKQVSVRTSDGIFFVPEITKGLTCN